MTIHEMKLKVEQMGYEVIGYREGDTAVEIRIVAPIGPDGRKMLHEVPADLQSLGFRHCRRGAIYGEY